MVTLEYTHDGKIYCLPVDLNLQGYLSMSGFCDIEIAPQSYNYGYVSIYSINLYDSQIIDFDYYFPSNCLPNWWESFFRHKVYLGTYFELPVESDVLGSDTELVVESETSISIFDEVKVIESLLGVQNQLSNQIFIIVFVALAVWLSLKVLGLLHNLLDLFLG